MKDIRSNCQQGFTLVELLIATTILAVILLMATVVITGIGKLYYKGINTSQTQDTTRAIVNDVSQQLQLIKAAPAQTAAQSDAYGRTQAYCIGSVRYTYVLGKQVIDGTTTIDHALWRDANPNPGGSTCTAALSYGSGTDMIGKRARLVSFTIKPSGNGSYYIYVSTAYGDDDLLYRPQNAGCTTTNCKYANDTPSDPLTCRGQTGDQYCATAELETTVSQRL